jgi:hypothetical protein
MKTRNKTNIFKKYRKEKREKNKGKNQGKHIF